MGTFDVPAILDKITEVSECDKVSWIGYSQGTSQLFYSLATDEDKIADKLERAIMLAPCALTAPMFDADMHMQLFDTLRHEGIIMANDELSQAHVSKVCRKVTSRDIYPQAYYDLACSIYPTFLGDFEAWPIKSMELYDQNGLADRFQEYVEKFGPGNLEGPLVSPGLGSIRRVPLLFSAAEKDESCTLDRVQRVAHEIGDAVVSFRVVEGATH